ncbi:hypothetical protein D3C81_1600570 [compost metagenome]
MLTFDSVIGQNLREHIEIWSFHLYRGGEMQILELTFELVLGHFDHVLEVCTYDVASRNRGCIALTVHNLNRFLVVIHPALQALKNRSPTAVAAAANIKQCFITKFISNCGRIRAIRHAYRCRECLNPLQLPICWIREFHKIHFIRTNMTIQYI